VQPGPEDQLQLLDDVIEEVEEFNLTGCREIPATLRSAIRKGAARISVKAPRAVWIAQSSPRLHEGLLDWQGRLLDAFRSHRVAYTDRFD
jgi:hypothetical protein